MVEIKQLTPAGIGVEHVRNVEDGLIEEVVVEGCLEKFGEEDNSDDDDSEVDSFKTHKHLTVWFLSLDFYNLDPLGLLILNSL